MTRIAFADTLYWIAAVNPNDQHHGAAQAARQALGECILVTTDEVLGEFLTAMSRSGAMLRRKAAEAVRKALENPNVKVLPQSRASFLNALSRYAQRADQQYSFVDCSSMVAMEAEGITDVLTGDAHFRQAGFNVLISAIKS